MPKIVVVHDVEDVDRWLSFSAERADAIGKLGGSNVVDHAPADGGNTIAVTTETQDVEGMLAAIGAPAPELLETMQRHGVVPPLKIFVQR